MLTNYEIGIKTDLFDRKLRFNVTGFYGNADGRPDRRFGLPSDGSDAVRGAGQRRQRA